MAKISLMRVDFRLIHGQVITKWLRQTDANEILIIDDELANDDFMADIYRMAAPVGIKVTVITVADACEGWKKDNMGDRKLFVLFKNVSQIYKAFQNGFPTVEFQIGGLGSGPGKQVVFGPISLDVRDVEQLTEMNALGCKIYFHQVPEESSGSFETVIGHFKK